MSTKSPIFMPSVAAFDIGWKWMRGMEGSTAEQSSRKVTAWAEMSFIRARPDTHPCFTPRVEKSVSSSEKRKSFVPACLATVLRSTCLGEGGRAVEEGKRVEDKDAVQYGSVTMLFCPLQILPHIYCISVHLRC